MTAEITADAYMLLCLYQSTGLFMYLRENGVLHVAATIRLQSTSHPGPATNTMRGAHPSQMVHIPACIFGYTLYNFFFNVHNFVQEESLRAKMTS